MTEDAIKAVIQDPKFNRFLHREAGRLFGQDEESGKDAIAEGLARLVKLPEESTAEECRKAAARGMAAFYQRNRLRRKRETPDDFGIQGDGESLKASAGLHKLAQIAVDGDW